LINDPIQLEHAVVKVAHSVFNQKQNKYSYQEAKVFLIASDSSFLIENKTYSSDEIKREFIMHLIKKVGTYERYLINNNQAYFDKHMGIIITNTDLDKRMVIKPDSEKDQIFSCKSQVKQNYVINKKSLLLA
jgi:hypothetical protein